jgi:hypothetical protein
MSTQITSRNVTDPPPRLLDVVHQHALETTSRMDAVWESREKLYAAILRAADEGITYARIARAANLSRERVRQIVEQRPSGGYGPSLRETPGGVASKKGSMEGTL